MSISPFSNSTASPTVGPSARTTLSERIETASDGASSALGSIADAAADGVSATVSFSGEALRALEDAGAAVLDGAKDLATGTWHAVESAALEVEDVGSAVAGKVGAGVKTVAEEIGHYAEVGLKAAGAAATDIASGAVMAASAVGKSLGSIGALI